MAEEYNLIEERKRAEEQRKKDREEFEKRLNDLAARRDERMPSVDQIFLNENQIKDYQSRLTTNLDKREELRDYLLGLLFKSQKTQDPEVDPTTGDVTYTEGRRIKPITANTLANEAKQEDRVGKSKIGNFFRNIDYSLSDYKTRDMGVGANQQRQAMQLLDNLLKDQGTEIGRSINTQNTFAAKNAQINQKTDKDAADVALRTRALDQKDVAQGFGDVLRGMQIQGVQDMNKKKGALIDSQTEGQNLRNKFFAPYGSREYQDAYQMEKAANGGKDPDPTKVEQRMNKALITKGLINMSSRGGGGSSRTSTNVHWSKDAQGRDVPIPYTTSSQSSNNGGGNKGILEELARQAGVLNLRSPRTKMSGEPQMSQETTPQSNRVTSALTSAARQVAPSIKAPRAVEKAIKNTTDENSRQWIASEAIKYKLDAPQIKEDERKRALGSTFVTDWNPKARQGYEGTGGGAEMIKRRELDTKLRSNLDTAGKFMLEAAADGTLEKVMGYGQGMGGRLTKIAEIMSPSSIKNWLVPATEDPDYGLRRMFPGLGQDEDSQRFRTQFAGMMAELGFDIQKDATGLQALGQEMERIKKMLPQSTDEPTVALTAMLNMAIKKRVEGHFLRKGYSSEQATEMAAIAGDYVTPRIKSLTEKARSARAEYANGKIKNRADIAKQFSLTAFDPDDMIGAAVEAKGIPLELLPVQMRRLKPKETSLEDKYGDTMKWPKEKEKDYPRLRR